MTQPPEPPPGTPPAGPPPEPPYKEPHPGFPPAQPPGGKGGPRRLIIVAVLVLVAVVVGVFAIYRVVSGVLRTGEEGPTGLREPLTFQQVAETSKPPCAAGTVPDDAGATCYKLGPERLTAEEVEDIRAQPSPAGSGWMIELRLTTPDGVEFGKLTGKAAAQPHNAPGRRVAMIVGGKVISAPTVTQPILGGTVQISGTFSRSEAERLVQRMTGEKAP